MNKVAIYPGTFDPITYGHIDVIKKGLKLFDKIVGFCLEMTFWHDFLMICMGFVRGLKENIKSTTHRLFTRNFKFCYKK